jgi:nucleoside-diphosphate-sugar epimerase
MHNKNKISNVSIIGGTGFIGKNLVSSLVKVGVSSIRIMTRNSQLVDQIGVSYIKDNLINPKKLDQLLENQNIVINLAYIPHNHEANMFLIDKLIVECIDKKIKRLVHCSSAVVSGRVKDKVINEETACNPLSDYEITKLAIENRLVSKLRGKVELVIIRPTAVFGEGGLNLVKVIDSIVYRSRFFNLLALSINKYREMHLVPVERVVESIYFLASYKGNMEVEKFIISEDDHAFNNYFQIVNYIAVSLGKRKYPKVFFPFATIILALILRLTGRTQLISKQTYSGQKLHDYGFRSKVNFIKSLDNFILSKY